MPEWWALAVTWALASMAGMLLGAVFYGGLWWAVRKGVSSPRPAVWFLGSFLLRTGIVLAGFYFVSGGSGDRLLACLLGFTIARVLVTRLTRSRVSPRRCIASLGDTCRRDADAKEAGRAA